MSPVAGNPLFVNRGRGMAAAFVVALFLLPCFGSVAAAELGTTIGPTVRGTPWTGARGTTRTVAEMMAAQKAADTVWEGKAPPPIVVKVEHELDEIIESRQANPNSPHVSSWPPAGAAAAVAPSAPLAAPIQTVAASFTSANLADSGFIPPDTMGAVGPTQFIAALNGRIRSFNKSTMVADGALNVSTDVFFATVRVGGTSDPRIRFDRLSNRWFIIMIDIGYPDRVLIAVSSGPTILSTSSFTFYYFQQNVPTPAGCSNCLADYPSTGIDANAIYIGNNMFTTTAYVQTDVFVVRKSSVLSGGPIVVTPFRAVNVSGDAVTPQGADNFDDPSPTYGFFVADSNSVFGRVNILRIDNAGTTPGMTPIALTVPDNNTPFKVDYLGNNHPDPTGPINGRIDGNDNRPILTTVKNGYLWTSQGVACDATGASHGSGGGTDDRDGMRWYQIGNLAGSPTLIQAGTIFDSAGSNPLFYTYGAVAPTGQGHAVFGMTQMGLAAYADAAFSGRLATDGAGVSATPAPYTAASVPYNPTFDTGVARARRWGDYSAALVDPADNMTVWTSQEYTFSATSGGYWGVRVAKVLAPLPATPASAAPSFGVQGSSLSVTITGTSVSGTGFYDPGAGYPNHISAAVSGTGVAVTGAVYNSPTSVTLSLTIANGAATGARDITITNPDGQSATGVGIFTVNAGPCSGAAMTPGSLPGGTVGTAYSQSVSVTGGSGTYSYSISSGALPPPLGISSAGLISGTPTAAGTYTFTVHGASTPPGCDVFQPYTIQITGYNIVVVSGSPQSALPNAAFGRPLVAYVSDASTSAPINGATVTFTAPASGASGTFPGSVISTPVVTNASGIATSPVFTANGTLGSYNVAATVPGGSGPANFALTNAAALIVTNVNDSGANSLRDVVANSADGGTVQFQVGLTGTITLTTGQITIGKNLTIQGPGARILSVSGNNAGRIFNLLAGNTINVSGLTLTGGNASAGTVGGGAIENGGATLNLSQMTITGNTAGGNVGGAIDNEGGGVITIAESTLSNNTSTFRGGAIQNQLGTMTLTNSTLSGNSAGAAGRGGAVRNAAGATLNLVSCTVFNNSANLGGNLSALGGTINMQNSIIAGGVALGGGSAPNLNAAGGAFASQDYNLFETTDGAAIGGVVLHNLTGSPSLGALGNNGGATDTNLPAVASPVLGYIPSGSMTVAVDQRGWARGTGLGGNSSIGSVEGASAVPVQLTGFSAD